MDVGRKTPGLEYPNYLTDEEIRPYEELTKKYHAILAGRKFRPKLREIGFNPYWWAAQIDCRNLLRHIIQISKDNPKKSKNTFFVKSKRGGHSGGQYIVSWGYSGRDQSFHIIITIMDLIKTEWESGHQITSLKIWYLKTLSTQLKVVQVKK
jgi:hypothetical protein